MAKTLFAFSLVALTRSRANHFFGSISFSIHLYNGSLGMLLSRLDEFRKANPEKMFNLDLLTVLSLLTQPATISLIHHLCKAKFKGGKGAMEVGKRGCYLCRVYGQKITFQLNLPSFSQYFLHGMALSIHRLRALASFWTTYPFIRLPSSNDDDELLSLARSISAVYIQRSLAFL